ncbi:MAG: ribonuclease P protein component [Alphaproteobacteria bacterium]|nr:MAG: ribonuclease P protein component [Alphaproteobacteria bacterium]
MDPRLEVLKERRDFLRVAAARRKWAMPGLVLQVAPTSGEAGADDLMRFGITASRKIGNAVRRNRARRRLRALARQILPARARPGYDYVLIARHTTPDRPFDALIDDLKTALAKLKVTRPRSGAANTEATARTVDLETDI